MKALAPWLSLCFAAALGCSSGDPVRFTVLDGGPRADVPGFDGASGPCVPGRVYCNGQTPYTCDADGNVNNQAACSGATSACVPGVGCRFCNPGSARCDPNSPQQTQMCNAQGTAWSNGVMCSVPDGQMCNSGVCTDRCSASAVGRSYLGCDYWPTVTINTALDPHFTFAVVLSNPQTYAVQATITGGTLSTPRAITLMPGAVQTVELPWVQELIQFDPTATGCRPGSLTDVCSSSEAHSVIARGGAYHVHSNGPIAAYQFNPLNFARAGGYYSFTNDASLLLPQGVLTQHYLVSTWPNAYIRQIDETIGGFVAIVAVAGETTQVTVHPTAEVAAGPSVPAIRAGGTQTFDLRPGDVVELASIHDGDLSGTTIESTLPVAVFVGHNCAQVPGTRVACDHLEEQLLPNETWGRDYLVTGLRDRMAVPSVLRVISQRDGNEVTFDPPSVHAAVTLNAGQVLEFETRAHFRVRGSQALLVAQYMYGQGRQTDTGYSMVGDPAMVFEVPVQQYRTSYDFFVPTTYTSNFINVTVPTGTELTLDGQPFRGSASAVGEYTVLTLPITAGPHNLRSTNAQPFGIKIYGVAQYTSYIYPGGLDLQLITPG